MSLANVFAFTTAINDLEGMKTTLAGISGVDKALAQAQELVVQKLSEFLRDKNVGDADLSFQEKELMYSGYPANKIPMIKSVRERLNMGLAEAKYFVEDKAYYHGYAAEPARRPGTY